MPYKLVAFSLNYKRGQSLVGSTVAKTGKFTLDNDWTFLIMMGTRTVVHIRLVELEISVNPFGVQKISTTTGDGTSTSSRTLSEVSDATNYTNISNFDTRPQQSPWLYMES